MGRIVVRVVYSERRALAERGAFVEESHVACHINLEGIIAVCINDFFQCARDIGGDVWAGEYLICFSDFCVAGSSPVSTNPEYACCQDVIKANVVAANGDRSDVSDGWVGPAGEGFKSLLSGDGPEGLLTMHQFGCMRLL